MLCFENQITFSKFKNLYRINKGKTISRCEAKSFRFHDRGSEEPRNA